MNNFRLAPLSTRRDIAMLGLIHRTVLHRGPVHFKEFFVADASRSKAPESRHKLQLSELPAHWTDFALPNSRPADYIQHSALGLIPVYNALPSSIVEGSATVSEFQAALQHLVATRMNAGCSDWARTYSPRIPLHRHPLRCPTV